MAKDYYKILGVAKNASKDDIKKAYRALAHQHHPDKAGGSEARFKELNEAYQVLSDDRKRGQYDQFGNAFETAGGGTGGGPGGFEWPGGFRFDFGGGESANSGDFDISDIFEDFFGGGSGRNESRRRTAERRGKDIRIELEIPFADSIFGAKRDIELMKLSRCDLCSGTGGENGTAMKTCPTCEGRGNMQKIQRSFFGSFTQVSICQECFGTGKRPETLCRTCHGKGAFSRPERFEIFIPKGIREGEMLKISGKGEASVRGGTPGDLYVNIRINQHPIFRRQGDDLVMSLAIRFSQAALGETIELATLEGAVKLKIPEGSQSGDILKIRGSGAPAGGGYGRGDLLIQLKVEVPRKISRRVRDIIQDLKEEGS